MARGILMQADRNELRGNTCHRNGICLLLQRGKGNVIARNHVGGGGDGIGVENGRDNVVSRNRDPAGDREFWGTHRATPSPSS